MSTTRVKPTVSKWYLADDVRTEVSGKHTIIGLYTDDIIVFEMPAGAPDPTLDQPIGLDGIAIMCTVRGFRGQAKAKIAMFGTKPLSESDKRDVVLNANGPDPTVSVVTRVRPFIVSSLGIKTFLLESEELGLKAEFKFEVRRRDLGVEIENSARVSAGPRSLSRSTASKVPKRSSRSRLHDVEDVVEKTKPAAKKALPKKRTAKK